MSINLKFDLIFQETDVKILFFADYFLSVGFQLQLYGCYLPYLLSTFFFAITQTLALICVFVFVVSAIISKNIYNKKIAISTKKKCLAFSLTFSLNLLVSSLNFICAL